MTNREPMTNNELRDYLMMWSVVVIPTLFACFMLYVTKCESQKIPIFPLSLLGTFIVSTVCSILLVCVLLAIFYSPDQEKKSEPTIDKQELWSMLDREEFRVREDDVPKIKGRMQRAYYAGQLEGLGFAKRALHNLEKSGGNK